MARNPRLGGLPALPVGEAGRRVDRRDSTPGWPGCPLVVPLIAPVKPGFASLILAAHPFRKERGKGGAPYVKIGFTRSVPSLLKTPPERRFGRGTLECKTSPIVWATREPSVLDPLLQTPTLGFAKSKDIDLGLCPHVDVAVEHRRRAKGGGCTERCL
jgi:hypothetical protein